MKKQQGFTLIEIVVFITVTGTMISALFIAYSTGLLKTPALLRNIIARQTAQQCMEWFIGQRRLKDYSTISCPSATVPSFCTNPSGYSLAVNISCTTINGDANYKTITVTVSGNGHAQLTSQIANY